MLKTELSALEETLTCPFIVLVESSTTERNSAIPVPSASVSDMNILRLGSVRF